ncbi:ABC transporter ATP-binding protein [Bacillus sp. 165]|uniref:ABC transporter ATP-binding protein n=1 Tax=Bacillus sp. 165 TaxID=1529117 RepID=UPI001ADBBD9B|nr:ABC transporter ATP-binding protein [Bacillus sp. 165]MBO9130681.1 ABC transporter ATP-binding protein [Bacillus sp. 165]
MSQEKQRPPQGGFSPGFGPGGGNMMMQGAKVKNFKGTLRRLLTYLKPRRMKLIAVFFTAILSTIFLIAGPKLMGKVTTKLFEGVMMKLQGVPGAEIDFGYVGNIVLLLIGLYVISSLFSYVQQYIMSDVSQKIVYDLRTEVDEKLARLPLKYYDENPHGDTLSRVTNDIDLIGSTLQQSITQFITSIITIIGIIIMMLTISPTLTLISIAAMALSIFGLKPIMMRSQKHFANQQKSLGQLNGHIEEMYTGHHIIKAFGHEEKAKVQFNAVNDRLYDAGWRAQFISGVIMPMMSFASNLGYVLICIVGGIYVTKGFITVGDIQAFIQYSRQFSQPIAQTANIANIIQSTIAAAERVFELLDETEEVKETATVTRLPQVKGEVTFESVDFGYKDSALVIQGMNIDVKSGQTVAIVGPTGAGKTTLINLLMRFYEVNSGTIKIDGINITDMPREALRKTFGMVLQDTWLFNGTIKDNIGYGRLEATDDEIIEAAKAAYADHFIRTLPDGYDTVLNEDASNISQGQRQLLTIARAILVDPAIMILDEATSSVDTRTEVHIQQAMNAMMQGRTSFVIAHRLSTIKDADLILVMNQGTVIEQGTHSELLAQNGFYAELYNSQFGEEAPAV